MLPAAKYRHSDRLVALLYHHPMFSPPANVSFQAVQMVETSLCFTLSSRQFSLLRDVNGLPTKKFCRCCASTFTATSPRQSARQGSPATPILANGVSSFCFFALYCCLSYQKSGRDYTWRQRQNFSHFRLPSLSQTFLFYPQYPQPTSSFILHGEPHLPA